jgi:hypothetical protein
LVQLNIQHLAAVVAVVAQLQLLALLVDLAVVVPEHLQ